MLTDPISHPGRLLKREFGARRLSANRLALDLGAPSSRARTSSVGAVRSLPTKPYGLALTLATAHASGSTGSTSTTWLHSSVSVALRFPRRFTPLVPPPDRILGAGEDRCPPSCPASVHAPERTRRSSSSSRCRSCFTISRRGPAYR